jgi:hypothetical protein
MSPRKYIWLIVHASYHLADLNQRLTLVILFFQVHKICDGFFDIHFTSSHVYVFACALIIKRFVRGTLR